MREGRTFSDFSYEKPETGESRETLMKMDLDKLKELRDELQIKVDQYGSSRPVRYAKSGNTDVLGQQSAPAMDDKRRDDSYLNIIKSVIAEKESKNESKEFKYLKTFESFKSDDDCGCGNYNEDGECNCGDEEDDDIYNEEGLNEGKFLRGAMKSGFTFFGLLKSGISLLTLNLKKIKEIWKGMPYVYKVIDLFDFMNGLKKFEDIEDFMDFALNTYPDDHTIKHSSVLNGPMIGDFMRNVVMTEYKKEFGRDIESDLIKLEEVIDEKNKKKGEMSPKEYKDFQEFEMLIEELGKMIYLDEDTEYKTTTIGELKELGE